MKKLIRGILDFHRQIQPGYRETFRRLALGQKPDALLIACSDSRVVPNLFASTDPGDLFVVRNVGNLVPVSNSAGRVEHDDSQGACVDFAVETLGVSSIIVCGHSECGAMQSALGDRKTLSSQNLRQWLTLVDPAVGELESNPLETGGLAPHNRLSQLNVLRQMENLRTFPPVRDRLAQRTLGLYGWWFDIGGAEVLSYNPERNRFVLLDDEEAERLLHSLPCR